MWNGGIVFFLAADFEIPGGEACTRKKKVIKFCHFWTFQTISFFENFLCTRKKIDDFFSRTEIFAYRIFENKIRRKIGVLIAPQGRKIVFYMF